MPCSGRCAENVLPLPADAAVSGYSFCVGERRIQGEIDRTRTARERYEDAIARGHTAALLEQERSSLFTQEIGNVPPGAGVVCEIVLDQRLRWLEDGSWEWRFPLARRTGKRDGVRRYCCCLPRACRTGILGSGHDRAARSLAIKHVNVTTIDRECV